MEQHKNPLMRKVTGYDEHSRYEMKRPRVALLQEEGEHTRDIDGNP